MLQNGSIILLNGPKSPQHINKREIHVGKVELKHVKTIINTKTKWLIKIMRQQTLQIICMFK